MALLSAIPSPSPGAKQHAHRAHGRRAEPDRTRRAAAASGRAARSRSRSAPRSSRRSTDHGDGPLRRLPLRRARRSRERAAHRMPEPGSTPRYDVRLLHDQRVPMRDGITLSADVYLPLGAQGRCRRSSSGRRTSRRASASSPGASGSRSAATPRSSSTCRGRYESEGVFTPWIQDGARRARHAHLGRRRAVVQRAHRHLGPELRRRSSSGSSRISATRTSQCIAPQVIHDDYFWDGYWTGGAFQLALTLGAAALWTSAMALITGPSAARPRAQRPRLRPPAADRARRGDDRAQGRLLAALVGAPDERRVLAAVPAPPGEGERADLPAGRLVRPVLGLAPALVRGDRRPRAEPRPDRARGRTRRRSRPSRGDVDLSPGADRDPRPRARLLRPLPEGRRRTAGTTRPPLELYVLGANEWRGESEWPLAGTELDAVVPALGGRANTMAATVASISSRPRAASRPTATPTTPRTRCRRSAASTRC